MKTLLITPVSARAPSGDSPLWTRQFRLLSQVSAQLRLENLCRPQEEASKSVGMMYRVNESIRSMDLFILVPSVPEVKRQEYTWDTLINITMATLLDTITLFKDVLVLNGSFGCFKANSSAPFKHDSSFCHRLKSHFKGAKRVSSDQSDSKK